MRPSNHKPACFLERFSEKPCDGALVRVHLIPRQQLRKLWAAAHNPTGRHAVRIDLPFKTLRDLINDERTWVPGCGGPMGNAGHHGMLDTSRKLRIPRSEIPAGTEEIAEELGLGWWLTREYGPREERVVSEAPVRFPEVERPSAGSNNDRRLADDAIQRKEPRWVQ